MKAHPGYGHEEWLGLSVSERIDRAEAAQGAAPRACNDPRHDMIEAWYRQALEARAAPRKADMDKARAALAAPRAEGLDWRAESRRHDLLVVAANLMERWRDMPSDLFENEQAANVRLRRERDKWLANYHDHAAALTSRPSNERVP